MLEEQLFDDTETRAALSGSGIECPPARDYFATLVRYALQTGFGERPHASRSAGGTGDPSAV
jgi:hypothetical protein